MYRLTGHTVIGPKTAWCGSTRAKIVTTRELGSAPVKSCGNCGQHAVRF